MIDLESISFYLGMTISRDRDMHIIRLNQKAYIQRVAKRFGLQDAKPVRTPMKKSFDPIPNANQTTDQDIKQYQAMVGSIMFAMIETRPDIANAISIVSRFAQNPSSNHIKAVKRIIIYLNSTANLCIVYDGNPNKKLDMNAFCDAD